jgi:hypothetical protein
MAVGTVGSFILRDNPEGGGARVAPVDRAPQSGSAPEARTAGRRRLARAHWQRVTQLSWFVVHVPRQPSSLQEPSQVALV